MEVRVYPCVIIGAGVAGLVAGLYLNNSDIPNVVCEGDMPGGALVQSTLVRNYPGLAEKSGLEIVKIIRDEVKQTGTVFISELVTKVDFVHFKPFFYIETNSCRLLALTVIIATGSIARKLQVPGEETCFGKSIFTCTICENTKVRNQLVGIVGGSDSAIKALYLSPLVKKIHVFVRKNEFRGKDHVRLRKLLKDPKIEVHYNTEVLKFIEVGHKAN